MLLKTMEATRSYRRFKQEPTPDINDLNYLIDVARLTPSTGNRQPLKFILVEDKQACKKVFSTLTWAGYLNEWPGPASEEEPTAYIIILSDPNIDKKPGIDVGLAAQSIILGAQERGFGACLLAAIDRARLREELTIPEKLEIELVVALGTPGEEVKLTDCKDDDIRYWRDEKDVHYVPKRSKTDLILKII